MVQEMQRIAEEKCRAEEERRKEEEEQLGLSLGLLQADASQNSQQLAVNSPYIAVLGIE